MMPVRVKIQTILPADTVAVYKCDFGDISILNTNFIRPLLPEFRDIPQLAISAKLHGNDRIQNTTTAKLSSYSPEKRQFNSIVLNFPSSQQ